MACDEARVVAFLAGDLPRQERARMDEHLLACDTCWRAVQEDRLGSRALGTLLQPAPPGLAERIRFAVELAGQPEPRRGDAPLRRPGPRRWRAPARLAASVAVAAGLGLGLGLGLTGPGRVDPPAVSALVTMAGSAWPASVPAVHRGRLGERPVVLHVIRYHGIATVVAVSSRPFPMPPASHVVAGSSARAWMASRGRVGLYCLNGPAGRHSMLVAAEMPAVALPGVLVQLHLS